MLKERSTHVWCRNVSAEFHGCNFLSADGSGNIARELSPCAHPATPSTKLDRSQVATCAGKVAQEMSLKFIIGNFFHVGGVS